MGCATSKLDELEAVRLCRSRTDLLAAAIRHRYELAGAHSAYAESLRSVGLSIKLFIDTSPVSASPPSPHFQLPIRRKGDPPPIKKDDRSLSGSHIGEFDSDDSSDSPLHSDDDSSDSPLHSDHQEDLEPVVHVRYARNQPPPNSISYSDPYGYPDPHQYGWAGAGASSWVPPKPPPSPPRASPWDFLNPFEANESYYPASTPGRSSNDAEKMEGIPYLEDEGHELVKEAYGDGSFSMSSVSTSSAGSPEEYSKKGKGIVTSSANPNAHFQSRSVGPTVDEADVVEKKVVRDPVQTPQEEAQNVPPRRFHNVLEIGGEVKAQAERASSSAMEIAGVLEVGKHPYRHPSTVYKVSTVMMCMMPLSNATTGEEFLNFEEDMERNSKNLSSTLHKMYIWEKKLQDEVRAEEKIRLQHVRSCKKLKRLDQKGAEAHKLHDVQKLIRKLSTKIRIAIQVVDSISSKINKLRDEELWPQTKELIEGLVRMWKAMIDCHRIQCEALSEAKNLDAIASGGRLGETSLEAMMQLELELLKWIHNFSAWINAHKNYVKAINAWLVLCLHYEPEVTADGTPPYSPGRIGAPPVFVIYNYWSQALDMLPEKEVTDAMQAFATNLRCLWEQHSGSQNQVMAPNRDTDKDRERKVQIMHREVDALNKKLVLVAGQNYLPSDTTEVSSLHLCLAQIFEAMENFAANSLKAYEELHLHSEK